MLTDTPKTTKPEDQCTPIDEVYPPWDPRSPMQNRTPLNTVDPAPDESLISLDPSAAKNTPQSCEPYNPVIDPRSPLYAGNRTPVPKTEEQLPPEKSKEINENTCKSTCRCTCVLACKGTCREKRKSTKKKKHHVSVKKTVMLKKKKKEVEGKDKGGGKKTIVTITQKAIKRQIAFSDSTNVISD